MLENLATYHAHRAAGDIGAGHSSQHHQRGHRCAPGREERWYAGGGSMYMYLASRILCVSLYLSRSIRSCEYR